MRPSHGLKAISTTRWSLLWVMMSQKYALAKGKYSRLPTTVSSFTTLTKISLKSMAHFTFRNKKAQKIPSLCYCQSAALKIRFCLSKTTKILKSNILSTILGRSRLELWFTTKSVKSLQTLRRTSTTGSTWISNTCSSSIQFLQKSKFTKCRSVNIYPIEIGLSWLEVLTW